MEMIVGDLIIVMSILDSLVLSELEVLCIFGCIDVIGEIFIYE